MIPAEGGGEPWKARLKRLGIVRPRRARRPAEPGAPATRTRGAEGESLAATFLESHDIVILARNVRYPDGELDLVGRLAEEVLFVEVKWRRDASRGTPAESVTPRKRERLLRAAHRWLFENPAPWRRGVRFDVVAIQREPFEIDWIRGAFDAS